ncbi:hypothetical protein B0I37DRAFT_240270 [Chaetomium sp. MPI-CAGE-AT-0009]|nr:hypothetical protein B0I37DRAFT_240270 [Chaetomium sp. MPI-CAGE-AT-0009]
MQQPGAANWWCIACLYLRNVISLQCLMHFLSMIFHQHLSRAPSPLRSHRELKPGPRSLKIAANTFTLSHLTHAGVPLSPPRLDSHNSHAHFLPLILTLTFSRPPEPQPHQLPQQP